MRSRAWRTTALVLLLVALGGVSSLEGQSSPAEPSNPKKKILVELYTSQGCNSCPPASDLLGQLGKMGYGDDRVVAINFHVDYFNEPWADPYSDKAYSQRQLAYNEVQKRNDLYFTPLLMIDGRYPMLGSDRTKVNASLRQAVKEAPDLNLELALSGEGLRKTLAVKLTTPSSSVVGREILVGVVLTEDPISTRVPSGENAGQTLVEHHVARKMTQQFVKLEKADARTLSFPVQLPEAADPNRFHVAVFAQDRANGKVYQAESTPWVKPTPPDTKPNAKLKKVQARRATRHALAELEARLGMSINWPVSNNDPTEDTALCPDCGSGYVPWTFLSMPGGHTLPPGIQVPAVPKFSC